MPTREKKSRGRPPVPEAERRSSILTLRLSQEERTELEGAIDAAGRDDLTVWAREQLVAAARRALKRAEA